MRGFAINQQEGFTALKTYGSLLSALKKGANIPPLLARQDNHRLWGNFGYEKWGWCGGRGYWTHG